MPSSAATSWAMQRAAYAVGWAATCADGVSSATLKFRPEIVTRLADVAATLAGATSEICGPATHAPEPVRPARAHPYEPITVYPALHVGMHVAPTAHVPASPFVGAASGQVEHVPEKLGYAACSVAPQRV